MSLPVRNTMTTLTRLAGMRDVPSTTTPPGPAPLPTDLESQLHHDPSRPTRSALPLDRRRSTKSLTTPSSHPSPSRPPVPPLDAQYTATRAAAPDLPWGPQHPCFPHSNPHATTAAAAAATRVVRVPRDLLAAGDLVPRFADVYPEILAEWVSEAEFRGVVAEINRRLEEGFAPGGRRAVVDAVLGVVTGWVWDDLGLTGAKAAVRGLERWMERWNEARAGEGREVRLIPLRKTGFMNLDVEIPDPMVDVVDDEHGYEQR